MKYLFALCASLCAEPAHSEVVDPADLYVIDGDTVDWKGERFRLVGFDTPETYQPQCDFEERLGELATARLVELVTGLSVIELIAQPGRDHYGRRLGRLLVSGQDVGDILITEGLARSYTDGRRESWCE